MDHSVTIGWTTRALVVYRRESMGAPDPDSHEEPSVPLLPGAAPSNAAWLLPNASSDRAEKILLEDSYRVATLDHDAEIVVMTSLGFARSVAA